MPFILRLLDRCIFAVLFILGVQAPEFIQQYMQRLAGHLDETRYQLKQFQQIADINFNGELTKLIEHYLANGDSTIRQTGQFIENLFTRNQNFSVQFSALEQGEYIDKLIYLAQHLDVDIAKATLNQYQMAIPLEAQALASGLTVALVIFSVLSLGMLLVKSLWQRMFSEKPNTRIIAK